MNSSYETLRNSTGWKPVKETKKIRLQIEYTVHKRNFSIKVFFSNCDQIRV